ncbi:MAG: hypothetical protein ACT4NV_17975 [Rhodoferax sp.]
MENDSDTKNTGATATTAQQDFHEEVGTVAGRDAIDNSENSTQVSTGDGAIQIRGDRATVIQIGKLLNSLNESTLQANFFAATGIRCGKNVRLQLEMLMEEHGFHYHELARAWVTHAIVDDRKTGQLRVSSREVDLVFGWLGFLFFFGAFTLLLVVFLWADHKSRSMYNTSMAVLFMSCSLAAMVYFVRSHLHPQQVAKRVERALRG